MAHRLGLTQVFFGTPHRLHGPKAGARLVGDILRAVGNYRTDRVTLGSIKDALRPVEPTQGMIKEIQHSRTFLSGINDQFPNVLRSFNISIVNFFECDITEGLNRVVSFNHRLWPDPSSNADDVNLSCLRTGCERV